jgi:hypothetical protein
MPSCRDVLTGLIRARPLLRAGRIEVLGVDDFAVRRSQCGAGYCWIADKTGMRRSG